jgi:DNA-binding LacI/PurR family transcriptional regulator/DNA-binding NarL/FixJ family response regulator/nitrogen-specific signal transduction histidine kinase
VKHLYNRKKYESGEEEKMKRWGKTIPTIGFLFKTLNTSYDAEIWKGVCCKAEKEDINLLCFSVAAINTAYNLVNPRNIDGLICLTGSLCASLSINEVHNFFKQYPRLPKVSVGMHLEGFPSLLINHMIGMEQLLSHLIEEHGAQRIVFIRGTESAWDAEQWYNAYRIVLNKYNLPFHHELIVEGGCNRNTVEKAVTLLFDKRKVKADALVCTNDRMAVTILTALKKKGIKVPDTIALCGCNDASESEAADPPFTTVRRPFFEMGEKAVHIFLSLLKGKEVPEEVIFPTSLIIRRSCGCFLEVIRSPAVQINGEPEKETDGNNPEILIPKIRKQCEKRFFRIYGEIYRKWSGNFFNGLQEALVVKKNDHFLHVLEEIIISEGGTRMSLSSWYWFLRVVFDLLGRYLKSRAYQDFLQKLREDSLIVTGLCVERLQVKKIVQSNEMHTVFSHHINQEVMSAYTREILKDIITRELSGIGVNSFYLCLYDRNEREGNFSRLFCSFGDYGSGNKNNSSSLFPSEQLIPGGLGCPGKRYAFIIKPLSYKDEQLGFFLCEIGTLDGSFYEALAVNLGNALKITELFKQIKDNNVKLKVKVKQRSDDFKRVYKRLKEVLDSRTDFFISLAHATRIPLTLIQNYLEKYIREVKYNEDITIIKENINILLHHMVNLLDVEKLKRGKELYDHEQLVDFSRVLTGKVTLFRAIARKKQITMRSHIETDIVLKIDPLAADRIIDNLIDNAVLYSATGGTITVMLESQGECVRFSVSDTGIGIPERELDLIFQLYYQVVQKKGMKRGIGMGLSIVKKVCDAIDAQITVESVEKKGTVVTILFNRCPLQENGVVQEITLSAPLEREALDSLKNEEIYPDKKTVFIVDDDIKTLSFLRSFLKSTYNVFCATGAKAALKKLSVIKRPDIIISEIMMDGMDGYEFAECLSEDEDYRDIPLIFLTVKSSLDEKLKGLSKGAVDYFYKPFLIEELMAKIHAVIKNRENLKEHYMKQVRKTLLSSINEIEFKNRSEAIMMKLSSFYDRYNFTGRERDVCELVVQGYLNKEIGDILHISIRTVEFHLNNIYQKCHVQNKVELMHLLKL